jgi:NAD(P)-dependent dehydrogenase (short-subunit alcohol dehydrogenase family)
MSALADKTALVTGASRGIGRAAALASPPRARG